MNDPVLLHHAPGLSDLSAGPLLGHCNASQGAEMSHTPGPWYVEDGFVWRDNETIADPHCSLLFDSEEMEDNARLIAAAPDLLAALESLLAVCVEELDDKRTPEMRQARNAIAKAKRQA